jgi:ABC-2 type transport system ATP-binding protein
MDPAITAGSLAAEEAQAEQHSIASSAIYCQRLSKSYGDIHALDGLTLAVPYGSVFGFLGRNGAGKTTAMRLIAGLALPASGRAWVAGLETTQTPYGESSRLARSRFGYLPQAPAFYTWMSAREYLDYVGQIQGLPAAERRRQIEDLLALSDLKSAAKRPIRGFSGGMLQRLGIAQALIGDPPVLLLDEPTSALDPAGRHEVLDMIAGLRGRVTVFLSSHILSDVERVCDTVAVLHKGRLVLVSGRDELLERYAVNAAVLELDSANGGVGTGSLERFLEALRGCNWVASVRQEGALLRVMVQDVPRGKRELMPLVVAHRLVLSRYEWVRPSLEEIFLQLSA